MKDSKTTLKQSQAATTQGQSNAIKKLYLVDLVVRLCKLRNIPALIYLVLNIAIIAGVFYLVSGSVIGIFVGLFVYIFCVFAALSPVGEWIMRLTHGCKKIKDTEVLSRLEPLFNEVYSRAVKKQTAYNIKPDIRLYICDDNNANAFALGRGTVCVTTGLLQLPDDQIKAILGHEIGHLANHDPDLIMLITVGNFLISAFVFIIRIIILLIKLIISISALIAGKRGLSFASAIAGILTLIFINTVMWIWTKLGVLLVMKSSRNQEYAADRFSCELGYSESLLDFFKAAESSLYNNKPGFFEKLKGGLDLFSILDSSHPPMKKRIAAIEASMITVETE